MVDLIDRAAAVEYARHAWEQGADPVRYVEAVPSAGWVSVKDRLPEEDGPYIVMTIRNWEPGMEPFRVMVMELKTDLYRGRRVRRWRWGRKVSPWRVSHWMELPMAPEVRG